MTGGLVFILLAAAWLVLLGGRRRALQNLAAGGRAVTGAEFRDPGPPDATADPENKMARYRGNRSAKTGREDDLHRLPLLVHQLAGLLKAGRTPGELWADAARLNGGGPGTDGSIRTTAVLESAARAAAMGLSPVPLLREAALQCRGIEAMVWNDLAACVHASERSGAPLAVILGRYAHGLEAVLDARAARATALAGPKATVRVLTWLPVAGLALGYALGADPLAVLFQTPVGWSAAGAGTGLALAARVWTGMLVRRAAGPAAG